MRGSHDPLWLLRLSVCPSCLCAAVLGHLGTQQLGAVSLASLATSLATYIFSFLVFLTTPRIAAAHAHGDSKQVSRLAAVGLWLAAVTGTAVALGMHAGAELIVQGKQTGPRPSRSWWLGLWEGAEQCPAALHTTGVTLDHSPQTLRPQALLLHTRSHVLLFTCVPALPTACVLQP